MFEPGNEPTANELAAAVEPTSSARPRSTPMIGEVRDLVKKAPLALVVGRDDADFGGPRRGGADTTTSG